MVGDEKTLAHYASPYYDPVKAHEYYMRTRELKGRRSSSKLSDEGKKVWSSVKNEITIEKKEEIKDASDEKKAKTENCRAKAEESRKRIAETLKKLNEKLSDQRDAEIERIQSRPYWTSEQKKEKIAQLRAETSTGKDKNRSEASDERLKVSTELKQAVNAAREAYKTAKTNINESYEKIYQAEYDKILSAYAKPESKKKSKSK